MTPVVRVLTGYTLVIDQAATDIRRFGAPVERRSAGNPPFPCEQNTPGWFLPGRIRTRRKGPRPDWTVRISFFALFWPKPRVRK